MSDKEKDTDSSVDEDGVSHPEVPENHANTVPILSPIKESPYLNETLEGHLTSFKELMADETSLQGRNRSCASDNDSFGETARYCGARIAHEIIDEIGGLASLIPRLEGIQEIGEHIFGEKMFPSLTGMTLSPHRNTMAALEFHENLVADGHQKIDDFFGTNQAGHYTSEAKANNPGSKVVIGMIPFPGGLSKGMAASKFREAVSASQKAAVVAEELGFAAHEIVHLEQAGVLEKTVVSTFESIMNLSQYSKSAPFAPFSAPFRVASCPTYSSIDCEATLKSAKKNHQKSQTSNTEIGSSVIKQSLNLLTPLKERKEF